MRRILPVKSLTWWAVMACAVAAVALFLAFEVLDLDGSDLATRLFQPLMSLQPTLAEAERSMRHAACGVSEAGRFPLVGLLPQSALLRGSRAAAPRLSGQRRPRALLWVRLRRAAFAPPGTSDEPPSPGRRPR